MPYLLTQLLNNLNVSSKPLRTLPCEESANTRALSFTEYFLRLLSLPAFSNFTLLHESMLESEQESATNIAYR